MFDNLPNNNAGSANQQQGGIYPPTGGSGPIRRESAPPSSGQNMQANRVAVSRSIDNRPVISQMQNRSSQQIDTAEDMFSETEKYEKPRIFQAKSSAAPVDNFGMGNFPQMDSYTGESINSKNKTIVLALMLVSLLIVFIAGWFAYRMFFKAIVPEVLNETENTDNQIFNNSAADDNLINDTIVEKPVSEKTLEPVKDTDGDGLSDNEEFQLGTNLDEVDTDGDGLFDREEVKVYKTNPLESDSDKDGYSDGMEVKGGYNPNGDGKLYQNNN